MMHYLQGFFSGNEIRERKVRKCLIAWRWAKVGSGDFTYLSLEKLEGVPSRATCFTSKKEK